ncbi:hypothetical protein HOD75_02920 [archaeon]|jgi:hypothetical protein|nr:hypothetical protein [Candidatus Woesearchaeota archaeon]MBT4135621.1 hypothetical protein [archaeon]MBT4241826.1 hypothetical protein [archaeon]MBT4418374.1 hypothetical protein [archaeon]
MVRRLIPLEQRAEGICISGSNHYFGNDGFYECGLFYVSDEDDLMAKAKCAGANAYCLEDKNSRISEGCEVSLYYIDDECYRFGLRVLGDDGDSKL